MSSQYVMPDYFTPEQRKAIMEEGNNILVAAAAGCGKTTLLVERIIRKIILDGVNVNELVVVTFTEAAAGELKDRLESVINEKLKEVTDESVKDFLKKQLSILDDAYISTFHSLCLRLLKENKAEFQFEHPLQIADNRVITSLKEKAFNQLYDAHYLEEDFQLLDAYYNKNITSVEKLSDILYKVNTLIKSNGGYQTIEENLVLSKVEDILIEDPLASFYYDTLPDLLDALEIMITEMLNTSLSEKQKVGYDTLLKQVRQNKLVLSTKGNFFEMEKLVEFPRKAGKNYDGDLHDAIKEKYLKVRALTDIDHVTFEAILQDNYKNAKMLIKYGKDLDALFFQIKKETGYLEFDDLETILIDTLYHDQSRWLSNNTAKEISKKFNEIMVDEYQDTSMIQERITQAISNGKNTFMVGDIKQSIYKFRNATAQLFASKYKLYQDNPDHGVLIELTQNFRSLPNVLETTNFIFKNVFSTELGGIDYNETNQLNFGNTGLLKAYPDPYKAQLILNVYDKNDKESKLIMDQQWYASAKSAVELISSMVDGVNVKFSDFTILTRGRGPSGKYWRIIENLLIKSNIKYMAHGTEGFFDTYEIRDLRNLLTFLTNRKDEVALIGVLHSLFFDLNEQDLLNISNVDLPEDVDSKGLYSKLKYSDYQDVYKKLEDLLFQSYVLAPNDLIDYIFENTDYQQRIFAFNNFDNFLINIIRFKKLIESSLENFNTLEKVLKAISNSLISTKDDDSTAVLSKEDDVVNLMTIHKSKGLEFKYVILIEQGDIKKEKLSKEMPHIVDNRLILKHFNTDYKVQIANEMNPYASILSEYHRKENISEELRILYVALTRAKLQLFVIRTLPQTMLDEIVSKANENDRWGIDVSTLTNYNYITDYVIAAFSRHKKGITLRNGNGVTSNDEITNYLDDLFDVTLNYENLTQEVVESNTIKTVFPYKVLPALDKEIKKSFKVKPSFHPEDVLDFSRISKIDTYKQGSNAHYILEHIDFDTNNYEADLLEYKIKYEISTPLYEGLMAFFESDFFQTIKSNSYHKEYAFLYNKEGKTIKGIIDLLVESDDFIYIIDYKSDKVSVDQLVAAYKDQLKIYKDVIMQTSQKPIKLIIYSIYNQQFIDINS